jgi:hypothetical protein
LSYPGSINGTDLNLSQIVISQGTN